MGLRGRLYWHEAGLIAHTEFRDGNVPAGYQQKRVLTEALAQLPSGVKKVMVRSDTAGYQQELLRYCAKGQDERLGEIEFAVGVMVTPEFRKAVAETPEGEWRDLRCGAEGSVDAAEQQWAEVEFVPNWTAYSKKDPYYRFLAVREPMHRPPLPGMEIESDRASRFVDIQGKGWYKVSGVVTNRTIAGEELIRWYRERCGKGEEVHGVLKRDLAAGRLPSGLFGANAAWWSIATLVFNPVWGYGAGSELGGQAVGNGRRVAEQAAQGSAIRRRQPAREDGAPRQATDHTPARRPPVLRPADRDAPEHTGSGRRPLSPAHVP